MLKKVTLAALTAALLTSGAEAATQTGTFTVSATFNPTCTLDTSQGTYNFGVVGATSSTFQNGNSSGQLIINCSTGTPYSLTMQSSHATGGPISTGFNMSNAGQLMSYRLYPGSFGNAPWDSFGNSTNANGTGTGSDQRIYVLGEIPSQTPSGGVWNTGVFSDTVTATVTY